MAEIFYHRHPFFRLSFSTPFGSTYASRLLVRVVFADAVSQFEP
jgi:hypothetical protein